MNIFEQLDVLLKSTNKLNESVKYEDLPIEPTMATAEQAREYIRNYFIEVLENDDEDGGHGGGEGFAPIEPPPPPFSREKSDKADEGGDADKTWTDKDLEWDDDDFLKDLEMEADDLKLGEDGEEGDEYDDFIDKKSKTPVGSSGESDGKGGDGDEEDDETSLGSGRGSDEKEDTDDGDDVSDESEEGDGSSKKDDDKKDDETSTDGDSGDGDSSDGKKSKGGKASKGGKTSKGDGDEMGGEDMDMGGTDGEDSIGEKKDGESSKDGEGSGKGDGENGDNDTFTDGSGHEGESGDSSKDLKDKIDELLSELTDKYESDKERLKEIKEMVDDENISEEDIDEKMDIDKTKSKEMERKLKSLAGTLEKTPTKEEIDREIEAADKLSKEEIEEMKKDFSDIMKDAEVPSDEEYDRLRKEAMEELNKKCKGHSKLASSILYHSLKTPELDKSDWDKIVEKVLKKRSKNSSDKVSTSKVKKIVVGDKKHLWRDVRLGYKTIKRGDDKQSIYCFIDYSATVRYEKGLIVTFLGKILEMTQKLKYTDLHLYTFADSLSVPRIINDEMISKEGYETVLADTIKFFELPENYVGGAIEDFSLVGYEINRIKKNDRNAIIFIFGDGIWTFYGNWNPPTRLNEICPNWIKDIIAFVFYKNENSFKRNELGKEISLLKDVVGIQDVIVTKASDMKE